MVLYSKSILIFVTAQPPVMGVTSLPPPLPLPDEEQWGEDKVGTTLKGVPVKKQIEDSATQVQVSVTEESVQTHYTVSDQCVQTDLTGEEIQVIYMRYKSF